MGTSSAARARRADAFNRARDEYHATVTAVEQASDNLKQAGIHRPFLRVKLINPLVIAFDRAVSARLETVARLQLAIAGLTASECRQAVMRLVENETRSRRTLL